MRTLACSLMFQGMLCILTCEESNIRANAVCDSKCRNRYDFYEPGGGGPWYYHYQSEDCNLCRRLGNCVVSETDNPEATCEKLIVKNRRWKLLEGTQICVTVPFKLYYQATISSTIEGDGDEVDWYRCPPRTDVEKPQ